MEGLLSTGPTPSSLCTMSLQAVNFTIYRVNLRALYLTCYVCFSKTQKIQILPCTCNLFLKSIFCYRLYHLHYSYCSIQLTVQCSSSTLYQLLKSSTVNCIVYGEEYIVPVLSTWPIAVAVCNCTHCIVPMP